MVGESGVEIAHGRVGCVVSVVSVLSGMYCECGERAEWDVLGVW